MSGLICAVFIVPDCQYRYRHYVRFRLLVIGRIIAGEWRKLNLGTVIIASF